MRKAGLILYLVLMALAAPGARAGEVPSWMKPDAAHKTVTMDIVAGWNEANGALNFNGYHDGGITIVVPVGWLIAARFANHDGMLAHSMMVARAYKTDEIPAGAGVTNVAIPRAYSTDPSQGTLGEKVETVRFKADKPGRFMLLCGVPGHAQGGMWVYFEVAASADGPYVSSAKGTTPGWR